MSINIKDKKILEQLDLDSKISTSRLAKNVRLSQQVVDYRIKKLIENGIIRQFGTIFNLSKIGFEQYRVLFELSSVGEKEKNEIINYLKNHNKVYWAAIVGGKWDLFVVLFIKNYEEFDDFLDELFKKFPNMIKDYEALYVLYHELYQHKYLHKDKNNLRSIKLNLANPGEIIKLDKTDLIILDQIKNNCRLSSLEISKKANISYKTVQNRIKNLEEKGLIQGYRLFSKGEKYDYNAYLLLISFSSYGREAEKRILSYSKSNESITQAFRVFGRWSLLYIYVLKIIQNYKI